MLSMATGGRGRLTPMGRFAVRLGILGLVAALGGIANAALDRGEDDPTTVGRQPGTSTTAPAPTGSGTPTPMPTPTPTATTSDDPDDGPGDSTNLPDDADGPVAGVPSGVTGGVGDDVRIHHLQVYAGSGARSADLTARTSSADEPLRWRAERFRLLDSGSEYGTRSVRTARGLEARRIVWVTLRDRLAGVPVSLVLARYESGSDSATRSANAAYAQRVRDVRERLSRISTVIVVTVGADGARVDVPAGNVHPGVVLAVRGRDAVAGGQSALLSVQAPAA